MDEGKVIFKVAILCDTEAGMLIESDMDERYYRGVATAIADRATQDGMFYEALMEAFDDIKKGR